MASECHVSRVDISHIERSVRHIGQTVGQLEQLHLALNQTVDRVATTQDMTRSELDELRGRFEEFLLRDELARNLQLAQTQIIAVRQELETVYGHFATVRRLATGTLQAMDTGVVTQEAVQAASEELMITTPRYWLAPALVGLAAWIRDDRRLAERALGEALRRDNDKTSLFFALILRRQNRDDATARWLRQYVARQDPAQLSHEFTVVLDAVATGTLGPDAKPTVMRYMSQWYERLCADQDVVASQLGRWRQLIDGMRTPMDPRFTVLPVISPTWPVLKELFEAATVHGRAEQHFRGVFDRPLQQVPGLQGRVDKILDNLVTSYDAEEAPHRRRLSELAAIIKHDGDKAAAAKDVAAQQSVHDSTVDFLTLLTNAGFFPDKMGVSDGTQRLAIALAKDWIVSASGQLEANNLNTLPAGVDLTLEGWTGRIDGNATEQALVQSLVAHIDSETEQQVAAVRFTGGPLAAAIGAGIAVVIALASIPSGAGLVFFMLMVALCAGGWSAYQYSQLQPQRDHLRRVGEQRTVTACAQVRGAVAETIDWRTGWEQHIAKATDFRDYMNALTRDSFVAAGPDQAREVLA